MPLTFDFPFEQLINYKGINPKPSDFDLFWEFGLHEMRSVKPEIELIPNEFRTSFCECFDMYFTGVNGSRIHSKLFKTKNNNLTASCDSNVPRIYWEFRGLV